MILAVSNTNTQSTTHQALTTIRIILYPQTNQVMQIITILFQIGYNNILIKHIITLKFHTETTLTIKTLVKSPNNGISTIKNMMITTAITKNQTIMISMMPLLMTTGDKHMFINQICLQHIGQQKLLIKNMLLNHCQIQKVNKVILTQINQIETIEMDIEK